MRAALVEGYTTITFPDAPTVERDAITCGHCSRIVLVKPGTVSTVYLQPRLGAPDLEEPGAFCSRCMRAICLPCHGHGRCLPIERQIEEMEARGRMLAQIGIR